MRRRSILFYSVLSIFVASALVTLLGLSQVISVKDEHLSWLLSALIGQVAIALVALFNGATFFDGSEPGKELPKPKEDSYSSHQVATPKVGKPPKKTTKMEVNVLLDKLEQWDIVESGEEGRCYQELHRVYKFQTFEAAVHFMSQASKTLISPQDHHPRWENTYNRVEIWLTTFDLDRQLSNRDLKLACSLEALWDTLGKGM